MDSKLRREIEERLDEGVKNLSRENSTRSITDWVMNDIVGLLNQNYKQEIKAAEELAVGYVLGYLARLSHGIIMDKKWKDKITPIIDNMSKVNISELKEPTKDGKVKKVHLSINKTEAEEVREMLNARLPEIRIAVIKALNV